MHMHARIGIALAIAALTATAAIAQAVRSTARKLAGISLSRTTWAQAA